MLPAAIRFYDVVLFVHVASAVIAFGVTFAYPIMHVVAQRSDPRSLPYLYRVQTLIGTRLITPAATLVLLAGIYLVADGPYELSTGWISGAFAILIVLLGLGGAFFTPTERKLLAIAERDVAAAGAGEVTLSAEHAALARRLALGGQLSSLLVLVALFLMVVRPG